MGRADAPLTKPEPACGWRVRLFQPAGSSAAPQSHAWAQPLAKLGEVFPLLWRKCEVVRPVNVFTADASTIRELGNSVARGNGRFWANWTTTLTGCNWPEAY
jgi:hypothetical protein